MHLSGFHFVGGRGEEGKREEGGREGEERKGREGGRGERRERVDGREKGEREGAECVCTYMKILFIVILCFSFSFLPPAFLPKHALEGAYKVV